MKKKGKVWKILAIIAIVLVVLVGGLLIAYNNMMKTDHVLVKGQTVTDAILYTVDGKDLEFNVVYYGKVAGAVVTDETGNGIDSVEKLTEILGVADAPAEVLSADPGQRTIGQAVTADITLDDSGNITALTVKTVSERPIIGISWKKDEIGSDYNRFAEAFERNGAIAVYLPQLTDEAQAQEVLSAVDGVFVTGGEDWNPQLYGEEAEPHGANGWNDARDTSDILLMRQAIAMDIPMLTVCRGTQGLNVSLGGALIQDIPCYLGEQVIRGGIPAYRVTKVSSGTLPGGEEGDSCGCDDANHLRVEVDDLTHGGLFYHPLVAGSEGVGIASDSKWLYAIYDSNGIYQVATAHHQAIDPAGLAEGLTVVAMTSDGIIEAVEYQDNLFALGLQWHPERDALSDTRLTDVDQDLSNAPLRELVLYAGIYAGSK